LKFVNLKADAQQANIIDFDEQSEIWLPNLVFYNSILDSQVAHDDFSTLMINQTGNATTVLNSYLQEDEMFNGTENSLVYFRSYKMTLLCEFQQQYYPFDYQTCTIKVKF
jgi:hypothetical protein